MRGSRFCSTERADHLRCVWRTELRQYTRAHTVPLRKPGSGLVRSENTNYSAPVKPIRMSLCRMVMMGERMRMEKRPLVLSLLLRR